MQFINMPSCESGSAFLSEMLIPQPVTWCSGIALLIGVVLISHSTQRKRYLGQMLIFVGMLFGALPVMNRMFASVVDCSQPEKLVQLNQTMLPVSNVFALLIMTICAAGVGRSLWLLKNSSADQPAQRT